MPLKNVERGGAREEDVLFRAPKNFKMESSISLAYILEH
jgi:hypothetical protein